MTTLNWRNRCCQKLDTRNEFFECVEIFLPGDIVKVTTSQRGAQVMPVSSLFARDVEARRIEAPDSHVNRMSLLHSATTPLRRLLLLMLFLFLSGTVLHAQLPATTIPDLDLEQALSVEDAVAYALQHNPAIALNEINIAIAHEQIGVARANRLPTVGVNVNSMYTPFLEPMVFEGANVGGEKFSASAQAVVSQAVWPSSRWKAPIQAARAAENLNREALLRTRQQVTFQTQQSFYQLLTAQRMLEVAEYAVKIAQQQRELAQNKFEAGVAPRLDVIQADATLEDARVTAARSENGVNIARDALVTQLGLPAGLQLKIVGDESIPVAPDAPDALIEQALAVRPELQQLAFRREQVAASIALIRLQLQPIMSVQGSYSQTLVGGSILSNDGLTLSAGIAYNLYNGGKSKHELAAARLQLEQLEVTRTQLTLLITQDVRAAWLNLQNATKQLGAAEKQFVAANSALEIASDAYDAGERIRLEVEQARLRAIQALNSYQQAVFQAQVARAQLEYALGSPVELAMMPLQNFTLYQDQAPL